MRVQSGEEEDHSKKVLTGLKDLKTKKFNKAGGNNQDGKSQSKRDSALHL